MAIDGIFLKLLCDELKIIEGNHIEKIHCQKGGVFVFSLKKQKLYINLAGTPYITLVSERFVNPENPPMFCMLLRKHLQGGKITKLSKLEGDRILRLSVQKPNEMGFLSNKELYIELTGTKSNIVLVENGKIIDAFRRSDLEKASRIIAPGAVYTLPIKSNREYSMLIERESNERQIPVDTLIRNKKPVMILDPNGGFFDFTYIEITQYGKTYKNIEYRNYNSLVNDFYFSKRKESEINEKLSGLKKTIDNKIKNEQKKIGIRKQELENAKSREKFRIYGELLKANLYKIEPGTQSVTVENYYDELKPVTIPLKSSLSPQKNAAQYFNQYKKMCSAANVVEELLKQSENELLYLQSVKDEILRADSVETAENIRAELINAKIIRPKKAAAKKTKPKFSFLEDEYKGFKIYIGKNNIENDELTLNFADKTDVWFHTKNIPGSHVIVKTGDSALPDEVIVYAATLAARHSAAAPGAKVAVDYTPVKFIKKPNGAKPGMVIFKTNSTVLVTP